MKGHLKNGPEKMKARWEKEDDKAPRESYAGKGTNVEKEGIERKRGGRTAKKGPSKAEGWASEYRADRKPRKHGGRADKNPLSSAHNAKKPVGRGDLELN